MRYLICVLLWIRSATVFGAEPFYQKLLTQPESLSPPKAGSVTGALGDFILNPNDIARGSLAYSIPLDFRTQRGPLLLPISPRYDINHGLSEWGLGWKLDFSIQRYRFDGPINYKDDIFISPWGPLLQGVDGYWYPEGLQQKFRIKFTNGEVQAYGPEGETYFFRDKIESELGVYSYHLNEVRSITDRRTLIEYEKSQNVLYFKSIQYGGQGKNLPYRIAFSYEELPASHALISFKSGATQIYRRAIKELNHYLDVDTRSTLLWTYRFTRELSEWGPFHFLRSIEKFYPDHQRDPPIRFDYYRYEPISLAAKPSKILAQMESNGIRTDLLSFYDYNQDGLVDIETASDHRLFLQREDSFEEVKQFQSQVSSDCLPSGSTGSTARKVARFKGRDSVPQAFYFDFVGNFTICSLDGEIEWQGSFGFRPDFAQNALLVDIDGDDKADFFNLTDDGYEIYANRSNDDSISFVKVHSARHRKVRGATGLYAGDFNGDGLIDVTTLAGSTLQVYMGKGQFEFTATSLSFELETLGGRYFDPAQYNLNLVDLNQDGLSDILFSSGKELYSFINQGQSFQQLDIAAFEGLNFEGDVFVHNISGSGETMIFRPTSRGIRTIKMNEANTNLLKLIDDGKGSRLTFKYKYEKPESTKYNLSKVIDQLIVEKSMEGKQETNISFTEPYYRPQSKQRLAYGNVRIKSSQSETNLKYRNWQGISVLERKRHQSLAYPHIESVDELSYEKLEFQGIPLLVQSSNLKFYQDRKTGQKSTLLETKNEKWSDQLCVLESAYKIGDRSSRSSYQYHKAARIDSPHMLCKVRSLAIAGEDQKPYQITVRYQERNLPTEIILSGDDESIQVQKLQYDLQYRLRKLQTPNGKSLAFNYLNDSDALVSTIDQDGVITAQDALNERDLFESFLVKRDTQVYRDFFTFNSYDQLASQWNDDFGSAVEPLKKFRYLWPTQTKPGLIETKVANLTDNYFSDITLFSGSARQVGQMRRNDLGSWVLSDWTRFSEDQKEQIKYATKILKEDIRKEVTNYKEEEILSHSKNSTLGFPVTSSQLIQTDVRKNAKYQVSIKEGLLLLSENLNQKRQSIKAFNTDGKMYWYEDESKSRYFFTYDDFSRLKTVTMPSGNTIKLAYDSFGRLAEVDSSIAGNLLYTYNSEGLVAGKVLSDDAGDEQVNWNYLYDDKGRLIEKVGKKSTSSVRFINLYDGLMPDGKVIKGQLGFHSGVIGEKFEKTMIYDTKGRLAERQLKLKKDNITIQQTFSYDAHDRQIKMVTRTFRGKIKLQSSIGTEFDQLGRVSQINLADKSIQLNYDDLNLLQDLSGSYDGVYQHDSLTGERLGFSRESKRPTSYLQQRNQFGEVEQESYVIDGKPTDVGHTYDARSYLTRTVSDQLIQEFDYSEDGYFTLIPQAVGSKSPNLGSKYKFDKLGRMTKKEDHFYVYGPTGRIETVRFGNHIYEIAYDENLQPLAIWKDNQLARVSWEQVTFHGEEWFQTVNHQGHILGWLRNGVFEAKDYDFRGTLISKTPTAPYGDRHLNTSRIVDFAGHAYLPEIGLVAMGARYYAPDLKRFVTPDLYFMENPERCIESPVECNLYSYAKNNPLKYTDPNGQWAFLAVIGFALASDFIFNPSTANAPGVDNKIDTSMPPETKVGLAIAAWSLASSTVNAAGNLPAGVKAVFSRPFLAGSETGVVRLGKGLERGVENRHIFNSFNEARMSAKQFSGIGDDAVDFVQEIGPLKGQVTGRMSPDGLRGWRVDFDGKKGFHVNWWNRTAGTKRSDWIYGSNEVGGKSYDDFKKLLDHGFPKK